MDYDSRNMASANRNIHNHIRMTRASSMNSTKDRTIPNGSSYMANNDDKNDTGNPSPSSFPNSNRDRTSKGRTGMNRNSRGYGTS